MTSASDHALFQWQAGQRRLRDAPASERIVLERVTDGIARELRRRLGGRFTTAELVELYDAGIDWCLQLAMGLAPEQPSAWEGGIVVDAAFGRYLREAADFAGGRRLHADRES